MTGEHVLRIEGLWASVADTEILRGIDLEIRPGEVHAVMGRNGSGKSTLSHVLMGRPGYEVTAGSVTLDGVDLLPHLSGKNKSLPHEALFWSNGPNKAARMGKWKLVKAGEHSWLFDLDKDIGETINLAEEKPQVLEKLEAALRRWQGEMKPPAWPSKPNRRKMEIDGIPWEMNI